jgi:hypothetical protein
MAVTLTSANETLKDFYPLAGTRLKQYVVDTRRELDWERETCPTFEVPEHDDNTGATCRNAYGPTSWEQLDHGACSICGVLRRFISNDARVVAWVAEKASRPPIESDRTKLSDEIEPERALEPHPMLAMLARKP